MNGAEQIRESIRSIAVQNLQTRVCKVLEVDTKKSTCKVTPLDGDGATIPGVRLKAIIDANPTGILPIPAKNSIALVSMIDNDPEYAFINKCSEIDHYLISLQRENEDEKKEILLDKTSGCIVNIGDNSLQITDRECSVTIGGSTLEIKNDGTITLNGGALGGLIKVNDLVAKINAIETEIKNLATNYKSHIHPTSAPGAPTSPSPTAAAYPPPTIATTKADIENPNITHG